MRKYCLLCAADMMSRQEEKQRRAAAIYFWALRRELSDEERLVAERKLKEVRASPHTTTNSNTPPSLHTVSSHPSLFTLSSHPSFSLCLLILLRSVFSHLLVHKQMPSHPSLFT